MIGVCECPLGRKENICVEHAAAENASRVAGPGVQPPPQDPEVEVRVAGALERAKARREADRQGPGEDGGRGDVGGQREHGWAPFHPHNARAAWHHPCWRFARHSFVACQNPPYFGDRLLVLASVIVSSAAAFLRCIGVHLRLLFAVRSVPSRPICSCPSASSVARELNGHNPSSLFSSSLTTLGLAFPFDAFITCPTRKPKALLRPFGSAPPRPDSRRPRRERCRSARPCRRSARGPRLHNLIGRAAAVEHLGEHLLGHRVTDHATIHALNEPGQRRRRQRHLLDGDTRAPSSCAATRP